MNALLTTPRTRGECLDGTRPCPFLACQYHLAWDSRRELVETCTLDVADRGGLSRDEVGAVLGLSGERIRQIEERAIAKLEANVTMRRLASA